MVICNTPLVKSESPQQRHRQGGNLVTGHSKGNLGRIAHPFVKETEGPVSHQIEMKMLTGQGAVASKDPENHCREKIKSQLNWDSRPARSSIPII